MIPKLHWAGLIPYEALIVTGPLFWPIIIIVFGILIVADALFQYGRRH